MAKFFASVYLIGFVCGAMLFESASSSGMILEELFDCLGYIGVAEQMNREAAQEYCGIHFGSDLATILNDVDNSAARMAASLAGIPSNDNFYIGLSDFTTEGVFDEWADGTPVDYVNWIDGEPNDFHSGEDCVTVVASRNDEWNDARCSLERYFVCNFNGTVFTQSPSNAPSLAPTLSPSLAPTAAPTLSHEAYIGVAIESNYYNASDYCREEFGTELATINDENDNLAVREAATFAGVPVDENLWIGLNDLDDEGNWTKWDDGTNVIYSNWKEDEPNNKLRYRSASDTTGYGEHCAHFWHIQGDLWNDEPCGWPKYFVCNTPKN